MAAIAYFLACMGFNESGWSLWRSLWWPYYLAKAAAELARLRAEVERLQAHSYRLERWLRSNMQEKTANLARAVRAEAALADERAHADAMAEALEEIANLPAGKTEAVATAKRARHIAICARRQG